MLFASFILQQDPHNVKIRFRRARAKRMLLLFGLASDDLAICEQAVLGRGWEPPPTAATDRDDAWRAAYAGAEQAATQVDAQRRQSEGADLAAIDKTGQDRRRQVRTNEWWRCRMLNAKCSTSKVKCQLPPIAECQLPNAKCQMPNANCHQ